MTPEDKVKRSFDSVALAAQVGSISALTLHVAECAKRDGFDAMAADLIAHAQKTDALFEGLQADMREGRA